MTKYLMNLVFIASFISLASGIAITIPRPTDGLKFGDFKYGGTGCPQGTASISVSPARDTFTLIMDGLLASLGPGVPITSNRRNCQLNAEILIPSGWQVSLLTSDYRGFVSLDDGVRGEHVSTYYFAGQSQQVVTKASFVGPVSKDYLITDKALVTAWSKCGGKDNLNINAQVRLYGDNPKQGLLTVDSEDGHFSQIVGFAWRPCQV